MIHGSDLTSFGELRSVMSGDGNVLLSVAFGFLGSACGSSMEAGGWHWLVDNGWLWEGLRWARSGCVAALKSAWLLIRIFETTEEGIQLLDRWSSFPFVDGYGFCGWLLDRWMVLYVGHLATSLLARGIWGSLIGLVGYEMLVYYPPIRKYNLNL